MTKTLTPSEARASNIIDMALGFTSTLRVFQEGSKIVIASLLIKYLDEAANAKSKVKFDELHDKFCEEFMASVKVAGKELKNGAVKPMRAASFGHAAKMFDVCAKVWFHYCQMPTPELAKRTTTYLNSAIDTPILKHLKSQNQNAKIKASSISEIDRACYKELQKLAVLDRKNSFPHAIDMAQYDDILWLSLNR